MLFAAFSTGWIINGWRWNTTAQKLAVAQTKARIDAEQKSRSQELALQAAVDAATSTKVAEITIILRQRDAAFVSLHGRSLRGVNLPNTAGTYPHTTGAQLSRVDAVILASKRICQSRKNRSSAD